MPHLVAEYANLAAATIIVLLIALLVLNSLQSSSEINSKNSYLIHFWNSNSAEASIRLAALPVQPADEDLNLQVYNPMNRIT